MTAQLVLASPLVLLFAPGFPLPHAVLQVLLIQILVSGHDAPRPPTALAIKQQNVRVVLHQGLPVADRHID